MKMHVHRLTSKTEMSCTTNTKYFLKTANIKLTEDIKTLSDKLP